MWVLVLVFIGDFGAVSTEQISWYGTQADCTSIAQTYNTQRTDERPYKIVAECFQTTGYSE